jgi:ubiquinone/menaquinone biosynthesis C-methylase UbiE
MVSYWLQKWGKTTNAIDNRSEGFDDRAIQEGVELLKMDAADMQFEDDYFDFVFSYDAFEHFTEPESVLQEAIRVVKPNGYVYLAFGPLYLSPMGLHAFSSITFPYCQFLFPKECLEDFTKIKGLPPIDFAQVNGWSLEKYHELWSKYTDKLYTISYHEIVNVSHLDLIVKYPSCFKSKTKCFDNLIVSSINVLFRKKG